MMKMATIYEGLLVNLPTNTHSVYILNCSTSDIWTKILVPMAAQNCMLPEIHIMSKLAN